MACGGKDSEPPAGSATESDGTSAAATDDATAATEAPTSSMPSTSGAESADATTVDSASSTESSTGEGDPVDCSLRNPDFLCAPEDCSSPTYNWECGSYQRLDDDGCLRPICQNESDCGVGDTCYKYNECFPTDQGCSVNLHCEEYRGACECTWAAGCQDGPQPLEEQKGWCIPSEDKPC